MSRGGPLKRFTWRSTFTSTRLAILMKGTLLVMRSPYGRPSALSRPLGPWAKRGVSVSGSILAYRKDTRHMNAWGPSKIFVDLNVIYGSAWALKKAFSSACGLLPPRGAALASPDRCQSARARSLGTRGLRPICRNYRTEPLGLYVEGDLAVVCNREIGSCRRWRLRPHRIPHKIRNEGYQSSLHSNSFVVLADFT